MNHPSEPDRRNDFEFQRMLEHLMRAAISRDDLPAEDTPAGRLSREFFPETWAQCCDGLLKKTDKVRVWPEHSPVPHRFRFEIDCPFKRKRGPDERVSLAPGPVRGQIFYRGNLFEDFEGPAIAVLIDGDLGYYHPNYCQQRQILCIGDQSSLPPGPLPLDQFIECHLYPIVTYQNRRPSHALDRSAALYFAQNPQAMEGLEPALPLY